MKRNWLVIMLMTVALVAGIALQQYLSAAKPALNARLFDPAREIKPFHLINQDGEPIDNRLFDNQWTLLFVGYTHCPDVCPTTLGRLTASYNRLKKEGMKDLQVLFVSVDPQRDTPARLKEYTAYFNKEFIAATAPHKDLYPFVRNLGLMYSMNDDTTRDDYAVDHSASIALINPEGRLAVMFKPVEAVGKVPNVDMALMESDLRALIR